MSPKSKEQQKRDARNKKRREKRANELITPRTKAENKKNIEILKKRATKEIKKTSKFNGLTVNTLLKSEAPHVEEDNKPIIYQNNNFTSINTVKNVPFKLPSEMVTGGSLEDNVTIRGAITKPIENLIVTLEESKKVKFNEVAPPAQVPAVELVPSRGILRDFKSKFTSFGQLIQDVYAFGAVKLFLWRVKYLKF